jgi:hypothetical protein
MIESTAFLLGSKDQHSRVRGKAGYENKVDLGRKVEKKWFVSS